MLRAQQEVAHSPAEGEEGSPQVLPRGALSHGSSVSKLRPGQQGLASTRSVLVYLTLFPLRGMNVMTFIRGALCGPCPLTDEEAEALC